MRLFAVSAPGLERILLEELQELDVPGLNPIEGGVEFDGDDRQLYSVNLNLRTATRVLLRVASFHASSFHELERNARRVGWQDFIGPQSRVALRVTCRKSKLYHSDAVAERIARALVDATGARVVRGDTGSRNVDDAEARDDDISMVDGTQLFVVRVLHDRCTISADTSGRPLHMRGYREESGKAPVRETLAASLLRASGWNPGLPLLDPMCGAGTIVIEAALIARRIAPGIAAAGRTPRPFAFHAWKSFDQNVWDDVVRGARDRVLHRAPASISGRDRDAGAIAAALANARRAGMAADVEFAQGAISSIRKSAPQGYVVCNPPYGKRVGDADRLRDLYATFGNVLRSELDGWIVAILSASVALERHLQLRFDAIASTRNGGIPVRLVRSAILAGP